MNTKLFTFGAILLASAALFSCNKEQNIDLNEQVDKTGIPFEIVAGTFETKTTNDGMATNWESTDKISVFHAEAGESTYINDGQFDAAAAGASVKFTGTLDAELTADNYDWYAIYPYVAANTTPANIGSTGYITVGSLASGYQTQTGNGSKAHLAGSNYPVAGKAANVAKGSIPEIEMTQLTSVVAVEVTNSTSAAITVSDISFQGTESIVGTFYVNFAASPIVFTQSGPSYVSNTAKLKVESGSSIAAGGKAIFYLAVKPFTAAAGSTITLSVNATNGVQSKTSAALGSAFSFVAGKIHKLSFSYTKAIVSTASEAYTNGFESATDGFTATTSYNNTSVKYQGATGKEWGILSGSTSTTKAINGTNSLLLRDYTANSFEPYGYTSFLLSSVKQVRFYAKTITAGYKVKLSTSTDLVNWTDAETFALTTSAAEYSHTFAETISNAAIKLSVVLPASRTDKSDVIIDDITVSSAVLSPTVSVTTGEATDLTTATGTTATLNGTISLLYGATIGNLTEAGFYWKETSAGDGTYAKVTTSPTPTTTSYTFAKTGLTAGTSYTYKAYAVYDSGSEIFGEPVVFTPLAATTYTMTIDGSASGSNDVHWTTDNTTLTHGTVGLTSVVWTTSITWAGTASMGGTKTQVQLGKKSSGGTDYYPSTVDISTTAFAGKKILSASLTGFCQTNEGPTLTITAGTTDMLKDEALVKTTSTTYTTTSSAVTLTAGQAITFHLESSVSGSIVISKIQVVYTD